MTDLGNKHPVLQMFERAEPQAPGIGVAFIRQELGVMADETGTIKQDGVYKNSAGDQFFFRSGHKLPKAQADDLTLVNEGLPQTDLEKAMADRNAEAADKALDQKAVGAAPENKAK